MTEKSYLYAVAQARVILEESGAKGVYHATQAPFHLVVFYEKQEGEKPVPPLLIRIFRERKEIFYTSEISEDVNELLEFKEHNGVEAALMIRFGGNQTTKPSWTIIPLKRGNIPVSVQSNLEKRITYF